MDDFLTQGIAAAKAGNKQEARRLLDAAIKAAPNDERTWGWFYNVAANDEERFRCVNEVLRINPNNEMAKKKLDELIDSKPLFPKLEPPITVPNRLIQSTVKIEKKDFHSWDKILLPVLAVITVVVVCSVVLMISGLKVNSISEKINAILHGTPTPTLTVLPLGSDLKYKNWSIHIDRIETTQSINLGEPPYYPKRAVLLYFI